MFQRCRDPGESYPEGFVRDAAQAIDRVRAKPAAPGRFGLGGAGLQYTMPSPEDPERQPPISRRNRAVEPSNRLNCPIGADVRKKQGGMHSKLEAIDNWSFLSEKGRLHPRGPEAKQVHHNQALLLVRRSV